MWFYNLITANIDFPPARLYKDPIQNGPSEGYFLSEQDIQNLLTWYYKARGWDENGIPTRETLIRAGLPEVADDFQARGLF